MGVVDTSILRQGGGLFDDLGTLATVSAQRERTAAFERQSQRSNETERMKIEAREIEQRIDARDRVIQLLPQQHRTPLILDQLREIGADDEFIERVQGGVDPQDLSKVYEQGRAQIQKCLQSGHSPAQCQSEISDITLSMLDATESLIASPAERSNLNTNLQNALDPAATAAEISQRNQAQLSQIAARRDASIVRNDRNHKQRLVEIKRRGEESRKTVAVQVADPETKDQLVNVLNEAREAEDEAATLQALGKLNITPIDYGTASEGERESATLSVISDLDALMRQKLIEPPEARDRILDWLELSGVPIADTANGRVIQDVAIRRRVRDLFAVVSQQP